MRILLTSFLDSIRFSTAAGPAHRARAARWLAYPLLHPTAADTGRGGALKGQHDVEDGEDQRPLAEPWAFLDALKLACALCSELALGDDITAASAHHMLTEVLPAGEAMRPDQAMP